MRFTSLLSRTALAIATVVVVAASAATAAQAATPKDEQELIAILKSDAPEGEKALACKNLSVYGSAACVAEVAKLLPNERLSSWARIALEAIPGPEVEEALRKASESLQGRLLVGVINSIGVRRDAAATKLLAGRLGDKDADVASAAAVALGKIGNSEAAESLSNVLVSSPAGVRSAVAEGLVLCAEQYLADKKASEATKLYDAVRKAEVPRQRMLEATRGAILARGNDGIPLLLEQLRSNDKGLYQMGLTTAREFPGSEVDKALAAELEKAFPERAALIVTAMADRQDTVVLPAVLKAATGGQKLLRLAAINALGRIGNATCLAPLLDVAVEADADIAKAAKAALAELPGDSVDKEIASRLSQAQGKTYPVLIELVGQRRIDAVPALLKALESQDRTVRVATLMALGNTVPDKYLSVLITQVVSGKDPEVASVAQTALKTAAVRMPDRESCAGQIAAAIDKAPVATKVALLDILLSVGGTKALAAVAAAGRSTDPTLQDASSKLLGEWMTADAAPVLLELAKSPDNKFQGRSIRGYLRIARQFDLPIAQRAEMCKNAMDAAKNPAEQKLVIEILKRYPSIEMLKLALKALAVPALKEDATAAAQAIVQKVPKTNEVRELMAKAGLDK